jgi:hypothetical protein
MMYYLVNLFDGIRCTVFLDANIADALNVLSELLVRLVVSVIDGAPIKVNNTCEAVRVVDCSSCCDLSSETVTSNP